MARPAPLITETVRGAFERDGFVVLRNVVSEGERGQLMTRARELVSAAEAAPLPGIFASGAAADDYFMASAEAISCFLEAGAHDGDGQLTCPFEVAVNKIGHALHELDPVFEAFSRSARFGALGGALGLGDPRIMQSMYIFKQPSIGGAVNFHQDATFLRTRPDTVLGLWFALEDATIDNGCLQVLPGGHRGPLRERFVREGAQSAHFETLDSTPFDHARRVSLEVEKGSLVVLHGLLPHGSGPNLSPRSRHAYTLHLVDGKAQWCDGNWLQRTRPAVGYDRS